MTVAQVRNALINVMGTEVFTGVPNSLAVSAGSLQALQGTTPPLRLEDTEYTFKQLHTWLWQIIDLNLAGVMIYDANEGKNNVYLGVETQAQADAVKARLAGLPIPPGAVAVEVVGPYKDYVLRGEELQESLAQERSKTAEVQLHPMATQNVEFQSLPLVGGVRVTTDMGGCTYGFSAKRNGVLGLVTNYHCTANKAQVNGDVIRQNGSYIGVETVDPPARWCGIVWGDCRYADAAFFQNTSAGTGRVAAPRIAGTGPGAGDKTYDYSSPVLGILSSTVQNEHYIAVTSRTGFTRLVVSNTCTFLRTGVFDISASTLR